ncbi:MAG TPA: CarD family transcriptional regulator [Firmicutes bacterium]|nr:CarD family transcriptional regulator [Bacillota bacterium]
MTFAVGDRIVHPLHGAGVIDSIENQRVCGVERSYYVMHIKMGDMLVKVPTDSSDAVGLRPIMKPEEAKKFLDYIGTIKPEMTQNWNRRYRENMSKLRSGNLKDVAEVIKGLTVRDSERGLSTGERKMLNSAKEILLSEIVLSQSYTYDEASTLLEDALRP